MKHKKFTWLLIIGVAAVWGGIFYRIYKGMNAEDDLPVATVKPVKSEYFNLKDHAMDTVVLNLNYRDPFSGQPVQEDLKVRDEQFLPAKHLITAPKAAMVQVNWASVIYSGYINNPVAKKRIAILKINGKEAMLTEGQSLAGFKLLKNAGDSIKIQFQQVSKYISIQ